MNSKKAFSLFELIVVIFISSVILIFSFDYYKQNYQAQVQNEKLAIEKIDLNATKIFIEKHIDTIELIKYKNNILYYDKSILLKNITSYKSKKDKNIFSIDIVLNNDIKQTWKFRF